MSLPLLAHASNMPTFFNETSNKEYLATIDHFRELLPKNGPLEFITLIAAPYGLLDIQATNFNSLEDKNKFSNFNLGVMANAIFNTGGEISTKLPALVLCHKDKCRHDRLNSIRALSEEIKKIHLFFQENPDITILKPTTKYVYRINNAFFTPPEILLYQPSAEAGFIPSANVKRYKDTQLLPNYQRYIKDSSHIRDVILNTKIMTVVRESDSLTNVIFAGISNNHWGVKVTTKKSEIPVLGKRNALGYQYDDVIKISANTYYYQTN